MRRKPTSILVATVAPKKRGLKHQQVKPAAGSDSVATVAPKKRGLKLNIIE